MKKISVLARWGRSKSSNSELVKQRRHDKIIAHLNVVITSLLFIALCLTIYEFGFKKFWEHHPSVDFWMQVLLMPVSILLVIRYLLELFISRTRNSNIFNLLTVVFALGLIWYVQPVVTGMVNTSSDRFAVFKLVLYAGILLGFITEGSRFIQNLHARKINPGLLFMGSFLMLIMAGAFMLKLPNATTQRLSAIDAVFTSASAVCVTGLAVVDTGTAFTGFGHLIILFLIQIGGLGFMTLTGLLAYALAGQSSFKTQLAFTNFMSSNKMSNIMRFVYQVVFVTLLFEVIGAVFIYISLEDTLFDRTTDKLFFAVFHAVSAFCNAGFSTYTNGLYEPVIRFNYTLQVFVALLVILGGMGFPILFNLQRYLKIKLGNAWRRLRNNPRRIYMPNLIMLNSRLALVVSGVLLVIGFITYLVFEFNHTLQQHPTWIGKAVTAFFGSVTPRTAGFNTVDISVMSLPMTFVYLLLMWIGASPSSTGGGIKTTTAGLAFLNMFSVLRGEERTEFFRSEISHQSARRAFAIIVSSLLIIGMAVFLITSTDPDKGFIKIVFEAFSAFSTVGLSMGITPHLSTAGKIVLIITMFIGRVGTITLLVVFIRQTKKLHYRYPMEELAF